MTEAAASPVRPDPTPFVQAWLDSLAHVLGQVSGSPLPWTALEESPPELAASAENDLWILGVCSGGLRGETSLRIPAASTLRLAQIFMGETADPAAELTPSHREAAEELLRQVGGVVASTLKVSWGEMQLRLDAAAGAPSWPASSTYWLRAGENSPVLIEMHLSAALVAGLRAEKTEAPASGLAALLPPSPDESRAKLGLLMDVELALTLRFGSRRLLLREVLDLNPGAVVELDRKVEEPVDVLLDGRLVARGEVVVLNGNYGVRVTEVAPREPAGKS